MATIRNGYEGQGLPSLEFRLLNPFILINIKY